MMDAAREPATTRVGVATTGRGAGYFWGEYPVGHQSSGRPSGETTDAPIGRWRHPVKILGRSPLTGWAGVQFRVHSRVHSCQCRDAGRDRKGSQH